MTSQSSHLKRCFTKPSIVAYRRPKNLKEILVRAKISTKRKSRRLKNGCRPCSKACQLCWHIQTTTTHECKRTGAKWTINAPINCETSNVIYKLSCKKCGPFCYLGETLRKLKDRIADHRGYINRKKLDQVTGGHFNLPGHSLADFVVVGIERVLPRGDDILRKTREAYWINQYESTTFGNNTKE